MQIEEAIGDLPAILPSFDEADHKKKKAYSVPDCDVTWHVSRYHSIRDMKIFGMLADDIDRIYPCACEYDEETGEVYATFLNESTVSRTYIAEDCELVAEIDEVGVNDDGELWSDIVVN